MPLAGGLCPVDKRPQQAGYLGGNHVRPVNRNPVLGVAGAVGKVNRDGLTRQVRLAADGDARRLRDGEDRAGQLLVAVVLEKPRHVVAGRQSVIEHQRPIGAALSRCLGAVHVGPGGRRGRAGDHVRPVDADPILGVPGAIAERDLDRGAHLVNLAADGQTHGRRGLRGDAGREVPAPVGGVLQLPFRGGFRPGVEPKSPGAGSLGRFVVPEQPHLSDVGQAGELKGPRHRRDLPGHPHAKVTDRDHVVPGPKRKGVALEQQIARFFRAALPRHHAVVGVKTQHAFLAGLEGIQRSVILELNLVDHPLAAVECELVADLPAGKLDVALGSARIVVHHLAAGLQCHLAPGIHRYLRRCIALAVVKVDANLALGYGAERGQGGVVLELNGRQLAVVPVQDHRVRDLP